MTAVAGAHTDRARGVLIGMAIGDALGAPVEFESPQQIAGRREWLFGLPGGGPFGWAPGEFTDDTQMALVLARRLLANSGELDQAALAADFAEWAAHPGTADVGNQTRAVLSQVHQGRRWEDAVSVLDADAAGNGSLMRVAPVALVASSPADTMQLARKQSEVTHPNRWCTDACAVFAASLFDAIAGKGLDLDGAAGRAQEPEVRAAVMVASGAAPPDAHRSVDSCHGHRDAA